MTYRAEDVIDYSEGPVRRIAELQIVMVYPSYNGTTETLVFKKKAPMGIWRECNDGIVRELKGVSLQKVNYCILHTKEISEINSENTLAQDIELIDIEVISENHGFERIPVKNLRYKKGKKFFPLTCYPELVLFTDRMGVQLVIQINSEFTDLNLLTNPNIVATHHLVKSFSYTKADDHTLILTGVALYDYKLRKVVISNFKRLFYLDTLYSFTEPVGFVNAPNCEYRAEQLNKS